VNPRMMILLHAKDAKVAKAEPGPSANIQVRSTHLVAARHPSFQREFNLTQLKSPFLKRVRSPRDAIIR